jgi:hypothetical protein
VTGLRKSFGDNVVLDGVAFAVFSRHGERVVICLFDDTGTRETARLPLPCRSGDIHHGVLPGAEAGLRLEADRRIERGLLEGALEHGHLGERLLALLRRQADGGVGARGEDDRESSIGALDGDREVAHALDEDVDRKSVV